MKNTFILTGKVRATLPEECRVVWWVEGQARSRAEGAASRVIKDLNIHDYQIKLSIFLLLHTILLYLYY